VFYIAAAVYIFGTIFYAIFGSGQRQPWSFQTEPDKDEEQEPKEADALKKDTTA